MPWAFYRIDTEWAEDYNNGSISEEEYIELIVETYDINGIQQLEGKRRRVILFVERIDLSNN